MWSQEQLNFFRVICLSITLIGAFIKAFCYCLYSEPDESWESFQTRMDYGEFRSPAIRAMMDRDPECRARMEALLRTRVFRSRVREVESTRARLWWAVEDAKHFAARQPNDGDGDASGGGGERPADAGADARFSSRLLAVPTDEESSNARIAELTAKHEAAKTALAYLIVSVATHPEDEGERERDRTAAAAARLAVPVVRSRGGAVTAAAEAGRREDRGAGVGATVQPMEISSAAGLEEGRFFV